MCSTDQALTTGHLGRLDDFLRDMDYVNLGSLINLEMDLFHIFSGIFCALGSWSDADMKA